MSKFLKTLTPSDIQANNEIKTHLKRAKKEILRSLEILNEERKGDIRKRVACRGAETDLKRLLGQLEGVRMILPIVEEEKPRRSRDRSRPKKQAKRNKKSKVKTQSSNGDNFDIFGIDSQESEE